MTSLFCPTCAGTGWVSKPNMHGYEMAVECPDCSATSEPEKPQELSAPDKNHVGVRKGARTTEKAAAYNAYPKSGSLRLAVLRLYADAFPKGMTHEELGDVMGDHSSSPRARASELEQGGWLEDSGARRKTAKGSDSIVWVLTPKAARRLHVWYRLREGGPYAESSD